MIRWMRPPEISFLAQGKAFAEAGDKVVGRVVHYSATHGAQRFDRSGECGLLILETEEGVWVRVVLESFTLADRVLEAMALARSRSLDIGGPWVLGIKFVGMAGSGKYKEFDVRVGLLEAD